MDDNRLKDTGVSPDRALLIAVDLGQHRKIVPRSAALAREAANTSSFDGGAPLPAKEMGSEAALEEFRELVTSAGAQVVAELVQRRQKADPATLIGSGKVEEISAVAASSNATLILFDHDLTPTQQRNLEEALPCRVVDRTQLILDIFARHARSREGQLQVELAQLEYMLPRLAGRGLSMSQTGGGIGTRGPGETQLENDRRKIQRRLVQLRRDLEAVRRVRSLQRERRESVPVPTVALVGYTNAGKSTLFNALTDAGVLESSRMFATLDPKLRAIQLPSRRKVLLSDTVGFLRNLPHTLVTSFRATLEEVQKAEVLLHICDVSSPVYEEQKAEVEKVLDELDALDKPRIEVLNKMDLLPAEQRDNLRSQGLLLISARTGEGIDELLRRIDTGLVTDPIVYQEFVVPQDEGAVLAALEGGTVLNQRRFEGNSVHLSLAGPASLLSRYRRFRVTADAGTGRAVGSGATSQHHDPSDPEPGLGNI